MKHSYPSDNKKCDSLVKLAPQSPKVSDIKVARDNSARAQAERILVNKAKKLTW